MDELNTLRSLPDSARAWIYAADRTLGKPEVERLVELLDHFCAEWRYHGRKVESAAAVLEGRFAVLAGVTAEGDISGCGIDASVHALDQAAAELGLQWLPGLYVHFREQDSSITSVPRSDFRSLAASGEVDRTTPVFDLSIDTLGDLRAGRFEQPAASTWHGRAFRLEESVSAG